MTQRLEGLYTRFAGVTLPSGLAIRYAERGVAEAAPIVFLHGYTDSWNSFRLVFDTLSEERHAFAPDQRGHGESEKPERGYEIEGLAQDAAGFLDALGIERATIVGHSLGSFVAQSLAISHPERVERLVLIGSAAAVKGHAGLSEFLSDVSGWQDAPDRAQIREFQEGTVYAPIPRWFLEAVIAESAKVPLHVWRAALAGLLAADLTERLAEIRRPAWIVWGDRDAIFTRSDQDALVAAIPGARLSVYPEVGHAPHWERPHDFVRDLERFLDGGIPESSVPDAG
jgi:pimeloyl-ACP methyl ester carboxylesterase